MVEVREGSHAAFQAVMDRFWPELVRYAARELADLEAAEDVVQDAFVGLWQRRHTWTAGDSPRAYLYRMVRNRLIDGGRRRAVRAAWLSQRRSGPPRFPPTPAEVLDGEILRGRYEAALAALSARRRETFNLVFLRGLSHEEASQVLRISQQTVANQLSAALAEIRAALRAVLEDGTEPRP